MNSTASFGRWLKLRRLTLDLTHQDLARLAQTIESRLQGLEQGPWLTRLTEEHDNLRMALSGGAVKPTEGG